MMQCSFPTGQHKAFSTCRQRGLTASEQGALHSRGACRLGAAPADPGPSPPPVVPRDTPTGQAAIGARGLLEACVSQSSSRTALGDSNPSMLGGSHSVGTVRPVAPQLPRQT